MLNALFAAGAHRVAAALEEKGARTHAQVLDVLRPFIRATRSIRFEGDGYSAAWAVEAERRGLPNIRSALEAYRQLLLPAHRDVLVDMLGIVTEEELQSRCHVLHETYEKDIAIEARTLGVVVQQHVLPAAFKYRTELATGCYALEQAGCCAAAEKELLRRLTVLCEHTHADMARIRDMVDEAVPADVLARAIGEARVSLDAIEGLCSHEHQPFPTYTQLLFH
jgi:glutamine synthetase